MASRMTQPRPQEPQPSEAKRSPSSTDMQAWIAEAAYYRAERRGFQPGLENDDWLAAEAEIQSRLRSER